jgi:8-oxo-dGTP diphosphatase
MFALNQIVIPGSADVSSAGWNCRSHRSGPAGRQRFQEVEEWWRCRSAFVSASTFGTQNLKFRLMVLPYKVATLLYCFNGRDEVLLLERAQEPNRGLWSPCGGKLKMDSGESPYACACREAHEETGLSLHPEDLHLTGLVSEHGFQSRTHWLMFLFEVKPRLKTLPPRHAEGRFQFFTRAALEGLKLPQTDREQIWPWFWRHRGGFFAAHCHCHPDGRNDWTLEESKRQNEK